jgi:1-phosphofructokinase
MIYTCTLNPSIDYVVKLDSNLELGETNRAHRESFHPGGKGINVSIVLNNLGVKSDLLGFLGGFTGQYIENELKHMKYMKLHFTPVVGNTRINIKLKGASETEINANGPIITDQNYEQLLEKIGKISKNDLFILSGSIPSTIKHHVYEDIAEQVHKKKAILIVDSRKDNILETLKYKPFLIKPNKAELNEIFSVQVQSDSEVIHFAKRLQEMGAQNVLVSLGADGAILVTEKTVLKANVPPGQLVNSVGSGDSMIAGFVYEYHKTKDYDEALKTASACGSATAYSEGLATREKIEQLRPIIQIRRIEE